MGLPLGWLADRVHRVRLMAVAILFWSLMTFLSGYATEYWHLLLCRFGVGFGEAALVPAAVSLLADLFPPQRRALPVSVFTAGLAVGSGLALYLGGSFIAFAEQGATQLPLLGPVFEGHAPWQIVLMLAGLVGVPVAASVLRDRSWASRRAPLQRRERAAARPWLRPGDTSRRSARSSCRCSPRWACCSWSAPPCRRGCRRCSSATTPGHRCTPGRRWVR
jgi:MFS family permease